MPVEAATNRGTARAAQPGMEGTRRQHGRDHGALHAAPFHAGMSSGRGEANESGGNGAVGWRGGVQGDVDGLDRKLGAARFGCHRVGQLLTHSHCGRLWPLDDFEDSIPRRYERTISGLTLCWRGRFPKVTLQAPFFTSELNADHCRMKQFCMCQGLDCAG